MRKVVRFLFWVALALGIVVGLARATAIRWWRVPEGDPYLEASIAPTLRGGDLIILWRLTEPKFGDLVLCPEPDAPDRAVIGRIAGEAGDKVKVEGSRLDVNGRSAETEHACSPPKFTTVHPTTSSEIEQRCDIEAVAGHSHMRGGVGNEKVLPAPVNTTVEDGKVFLVSDNRLLPYDSRDFGQVDRPSCKETVVFRLVSRVGFFDAVSRFTFIR
jgi:signal peptidase I